MGKSLLRHSVLANDVSTSLPMTVLQCTKCDFAWQWPLLRSANESKDYFQKNYTTTEEGSYFDKTKKREICALEIEFVNSLVTDRRSLLDVGSGDGTFVEMAFERGWTAYGVDPAGPEKEEMVDGRSLRLLKGTSADLGGDARFDVITMWDVVEHLEKPLDLIADCKNRLVPGGWLVLETGNFQSTGRVLAGKKWWCYQSDHRWYFTPTSLRKVLMLAGFSKFRLCKRTFRPWTREEGHYEGPSVRSFLLGTIKRPWRALRNMDQFKQLATLSRAYPESATLQIFSLAAQVAT